MSEYLSRSKAYKEFHYSVLPAEMMSYLHSRTLEMLRCVKAMFDRLGIRYMICGGTLLGALTTGKFIPWDDDIDICLAEDSFEDAKQFLMRELPDSMVLQCKETEPDYYHGWLKVRDKHSQTFPGENIYKYNGVWIDLYKLTALPEDEIDYAIYAEHLSYLIRRFMGGGFFVDEMFKRIYANNLLQKTARHVPRTVESSNDRIKYVIWSASKIVLEPEWCFPETTCTFEGITLPTFREPEKYLVRHYGECYEQLPSDEDRRISVNRVEIVSSK